MSKSLLIEVSVLDDETGVVESRHVRFYEGAYGYGYDVIDCFDKLGKKFAPIVDKGYEP